MSASNAAIRQHHHITLCTGDAQEDYDFHTKILSLKSVKKTALYDGTHPIYHLYYGNDHGEESTLITCFPMRQSGRKARKGTGQINVLSLSVPVSSLSFWHQRLKEYGIACVEFERFGERGIRFYNPGGIEYELIGIADDNRRPYSNGEVPTDLGVRGTHSITVSVPTMTPSEEFMQSGWSARLLDTDGSYARYVFGDGGPGKIVDFRIDPDLSPASWTYGEGIVHHCAFQVDGYSEQNDVKARLEGLGFTDTSERKDRGYFESIYVRTPAGALFEATVSKPEGFTIDESYEDLGKTFKVPPAFAARKEEIMAYLQPLKY
ncbi:MULTISPECIES: VOC family protein [Burkholderia]|uniref:VOC family protein n=1 Tax=Burkholderia TaxID=32008 RepID=UPI0006D8BCA4|nr:MULTISPECIES: VOC family protein [Burkholderia]ALK30095.1 glyoxalase/bleomycin resistance protein/dioxygenase [Burkholderia plantarii]GLZ23181.1 glyoxalase [Burkholderia plantarii]